MLADIAEKNVSNACTSIAVPFDLWTGLFAIGGAYCDGGTSSRTLGQPKTTGFLVCALHTRNLNRCEDPGHPFFHVMFPRIAR
jgi:hypothetical protein